MRQCRLTNNCTNIGKRAKSKPNLRYGYYRMITAWSAPAR